MRKYIYISLGGMIGAVLRMVLKNVHLWGYYGNIPTDTLFINITGCFILALFLTVAFEVLEIDVDIRLGISTGLIGAYTTFSTLCKETASLIVAGGYYSAILYVALSAILGLFAAYIGNISGRKIITKLVR
nr:CrcB family protein [Sedimentibacter sp.]